jgi:hypothetical protein
MKWPGQSRIMTPLSPSRIVRTRSDEALFKLLGVELKRRLPPYDSDHLEPLVKSLEKLPPGLRAMAATYVLDVSMALDDLGWHFANWHHRGLALETLAGLREMGALAEASIFEQALEIACARWDFFASEGFVKAYSGSDLETALDPLNDQLWRLLGYPGEGGRSLLDLWAPYARRSPERVCSCAV